MMDLKPGVLKLEARRLLAGKYSMIAPVMLTVAACGLGLEYIISYAFPALSGILSLAIYLVCNVLVSIILTVLRGGLYRIYHRLELGQDWRVSDLFASFSLHPEALSAYAVISFLVSFGSMFAASMLFWYGPFPLGVNLGLMAALAVVMCWFNLTYRATLYLYALTPEKRPLQLMRDSRLLTRGFRLRLLWVKLSFLGVLLLGVLSFGVGLLFALPYLQVTEILYLRRIMARKGMGDA